MVFGDFLVVFGAFDSGFLDCFDFFSRNRVGQSFRKGSGRVKEP